MKKSAILLLLILLSTTAFAQKSNRSKIPARNKLTKSADANPAGEKEQFKKAVSQTDAAERISALLKFIADFPNSDEKTHAQELIVSGRAQFAEEKMRANDTQIGIEIFKLAVKGAPTPVSDKLFTEVILQIPTNIFLRGQRAEAVAVAQLIEEKVQGNAKQLLGLATYYIGTENAVEARRLAEKAIALEPNFPAAYQTLGLADRLNFQLDDAANAYAKALELDPESVVSKRSLAEMKRAVGKSAEAAELYRQILAKDDSDAAAKTGLALALFDAEKRSEAEAEMNELLAQNPNNLPLLVGAAYWYAAHGEGAKAVELGQKAVAVEPRYTWAHIALARGLVEQKRPLEAEQTLLLARQYGNFPTLDYELAAVRSMAGFYREAAETLKKTFTITDDNLIETQLGGRVLQKSNNFVALLAAERSASIFEPLSADSADYAATLKSLLNFSQQMDSPNPNEAAAAEAAENFAAGNFDNSVNQKLPAKSDGDGDKMKLHRQLYAADRLLEKNIAAPKAFELAKAAVGNVNTALDVAAPSAAVLADELYESRALAISRSELIVVPTIPRQTLSNILRGRIEEISGWALSQQKKPEEAIVRYKRALSVLPEKSTWWRDSMWRLGVALQNDQKPNEALDAYVKSYTAGTPEIGKRIIIESLYQSINGNLAGLDEKIGPRPESVAAAVPVPNQQPEISAPPAESVAAPPTKADLSTPEIAATPKTEETVTTVPAIPLVVKQNTETSPEVKKAAQTKPAQILPVPVIKSDNLPSTAATLPNPTPETAASPETNSQPNPADKSKPAAVSPTVKTDVQPSPEIAAINNKNAAPAPEKPRSSAFETIVITVPKNDSSKKPEAVPAKTENEPPTAAPNAGAAVEIKTDETVTASDYVVEKNAANRTRPRVVGVAETGETVPCKILTSQESVSILSDGGSLGVLVGFENGGNIKEITAQSSNPNDVEITFEPEIGTLSGRAFYVIKSVSQKTGAYRVTFESPCGKKEIAVKVR